MTKPTRADGIIRKRRKRDPNRFENLKKNKYGTPLKESKKESTKRARIASIKRTVCCLFKFISLS